MVAGTGSVYARLMMTSTPRTSTVTAGCEVAAIAEVVASVAATGLRPQRRVVEP